MTKLYLTRLLKAVFLTAVSFSTISASSASLTVADGNDVSNELPVFAYWMDRAQHFQLIYPEEELVDMTGKSITKMTFYISSVSKDWTNPDIVVSFGRSESEGFGSAQYLSVPVIKVGSGPLAIATGDDPLVWCVELTSPYLYSGGNLLVDIVSAKGNAPRVNFIGTKMAYNTGLTSRSSVTLSQFLPKCTFEYEDAGSQSATVSTDNIKFPFMFAGERAEAHFTVSNMGAEPVSGTITAVEGSEFTVSPAVIEDLAPGTGQEITVAFEPVATGDVESEILVDLGAAGQFEIAVSGSAVSAPEAYRETFDASDYSVAVPQGWTAYAEEYTSAGGEFVDFTANYANFPAAYRFSSYNFEGSGGIAWDHVNWAANTDLYRQYYYLISPEVHGNVTVRGMFTDLPAAGAFIEAYPAAKNVDGTFMFEAPAYDIIWDTDVDNTHWSVGSFTADRGSYVAFFMKFGALDFMAADNTVGITPPGKEGALQCRVAGVGVISYTTDAPGVEYAVYDLSGRMLKTGRMAVSTGRIELGTSPGLYIVKVTDGRDTSTLKIIK